MSHHVALSAAERDLVARTHRLARERLLPIAAEHGERHATSRELVRAMAEGGLLGANIPVEYGGEDLGLGYSVSLCLIREALGYHSPTVDVTFGVQGLGTCAILRMGDEDQRATHLPGLVSGERLFAFALSEPEAGSDVLGLRATARRVDGGYVIDGRKTWISGAPDADVYVVFARTDGEHRGRGISAFIVEAGTEGFTATQDLPLAAPHCIGSLTFQDCFVPESSRIGQEGQGLAASLGTLEIYRPSVGAFAVGAAQRALDLAVEHTRRRVQFDAPLMDLEVVRAKLARMHVRIAVARDHVYRSARANDAGGPDTGALSAIAKVSATEAAVAVAYEAQQLHGGRGVLTTSEVEGIVRAIRPSTIYEGTSEIQRLILGRSERKRIEGATAAAAPATVAHVLGAHPADGSAAALVADLRRAQRAAPAPELADNRAATLRALAEGDEPGDADGQGDLARLAVAALSHAALDQLVDGALERLARDDGDGAPLRDPGVQSLVADLRMALDGVGVTVERAAAELDAVAAGASASSGGDASNGGAGDMGARAEAGLQPSATVAAAQLLLQEAHVTVTGLLLELDRQRECVDRPALLGLTVDGPGDPSSRQLLERIFTLQLAAQ